MWIVECNPSANAQRIPLFDCPTGGEVEREGRTKTLENPKERSKESGISVPLNHLVVNINPFDDGDG